MSVTSSIETADRIELVFGNLQQLAKVKVAGTLSEWFRVRKGSDKVVSSLRTCSTSYSGDGDEGDPRWILRWTTNWRANDHEPSLC